MTTTIDQTTSAPLRDQRFILFRSIGRGWMRTVIGLLVLCFLALPLTTEAATPFSVDPYALSFNGTTDFVRIQNFGNFTTFSTSAWINRAATSTQRETIVSYKEGAGMNCGFLLAANETNDNFPKLDVMVNGAWKSAVSNQPIPLNQNVHISGSYDGTTIKLYVNGQIAASTVAAGGMTQCTQVTGIGGRATDSISSTSNNSILHFPGQIDEVRIWNTVRTQAQIQADMYSRLTGNEVGLVGYWRFDEGTGTTVADASGNGNTGTLGAGVAANQPTWVRASRPYAPPVAHYPLDGNANNISGSANQGTATAVTWTQGSIGQAANFNGTTSVITVPINVNETNYTASLRFKTTVANGGFIR